MAETFQLPMFILTLKGKKKSHTETTTYSHILPDTAFSLKQAAYTWSNLQTAPVGQVGDMFSRSKYYCIV